MKYRIIKEDQYFIKKYAPQWYDPQQKQWKYWGAWFDGYQRVVRFATMKGAKRVIDWQMQRHIKPLECYLPICPNVVWESSEHEPRA